MTDHAHDEHRPNVKLYLKVFAALLVLTVLTVGVSYLQLPHVAAISVGLAIAALKAGLVAAFFMHLKGERRLIYGLLGLAVFFLLYLMVLPTVDHSAIADKMQHVTTASAPEHH
jgi:cytochrome c oxidase subunit 4